MAVNVSVSVRCLKYLTAVTEVLVVFNLIQRAAFVVVWDADFSSFLLMECESEEPPAEVRQ